MKTPIPHIPGILTVEATPGVTVSYDAALNTIEIKKGSKTIRTEVAPLNYKASEFIETLQKIKRSQEGPKQ